MRPDWDKYFIEIAKVVSTRATCLRRKYGAIIVKNKTIISTGYCGSPRGAINCDEKGICKREEVGAKPGERYELCESVHAEQNAIISAPPERLEGATIYIAGFDAKTDEVVLGYPCDLCKRMIINSGIERVVYTYIDLLDGHVGFIGCLI